ncbi:MAG: DsbE family thiol:disulfide interchange protein [Vibrionaceae bacterium]
MRNKMLYVPLLVCIALTAVFFLKLRRLAQGESLTMVQYALIGKPIPFASGQDLVQKDKIHDQTLFYGKVQLLNVWASWCSGCYEEHFFLQSLAKKGINIIGLNYKDQREKAIAWLNMLGGAHQVHLFDGSGMLSLDLGVWGAPETFLIDSKGIIRYRHIGQVNEQNWKKTLQPLYQAILAEEK